jgi:hypothetical protein
VAHRVVDTVTTREGRGDEREHLVAGVRPARRSSQVEVRVYEFAQAEMMSQGGRQEEARVGHQAIVVEGRVNAVEAVR